MSLADVFMIRTRSNNHYPHFGSDSVHIPIRCCTKHTQQSVHERNASERKNSPHIRLSVTRSCSRTHAHTRSLHPLSHMAFMIVHSLPMPFSPHRHNAREDIRICTRSLIVSTLSCHIKLFTHSAIHQAIYIDRIRIVDCRNMHTNTNSGLALNILYRLL